MDLYRPIVYNINRQASITFIIIDISVCGMEDVLPCVDEISLFISNNQT